MGKIINLKGKRFGKLTVLELVPKEIKHDTTRQAFWKCKCDCGNIKIVGSKCLRNGDTKSCGCLTKNRMTKHGMFGTRIYTIWSDMCQRCYNKNNKDYKNYGGRGIILCDEWRKDFKSFYNWSMKNGYSNELQIDRIDNNGNYEPNNCRWVTPIDNSNNRRTSRFITYKGKTQTVAQWSKELNINASTIYMRLNKYKWNIEETLTKLPKKKTS